MKPSTNILIALITAMVVFGCVACASICADCELRIAALHADCAKLTQIEETKRQDALINARLQIVVNELNSNAPTEAERPSVWRQ